MEISEQRWNALADRVAALEERARNGTALEVVKPPPRTRGTRLPEGYAPPDAKVNQMLSELGCDKESLIREHRKFCDHFLSAPGQKGVKVDWDRAWCNWMRGASERGNLRRRAGFGIMKPEAFSPTDQKVQDWLALGEGGT